MHVQASDQLGIDDLLITLESDKAAMEVPSPNSGVLKELLVKVGDKVKTGSKIAIIEQSVALIMKLVCKQALKPMTLLKTIRRRNLVVAVTLIPGPARFQSQPQQKTRLFLSSMSHVYAGPLLKVGQS